TGVQTCALPIYRDPRLKLGNIRLPQIDRHNPRPFRLFCRARCRPSPGSKTVTQPLTNTLKTSTSPSGTHQKTALDVAALEARNLRVNEKTDRSGKRRPLRSLRQTCNAERASKAHI